MTSSTSTGKGRSGRRKAWRLKGVLLAPEGQEEGRRGREGAPVEIGQWIDLGGYAERIQGIRKGSVKILGTWIPRDQIREK